MRCPFFGDQQVCPSHAHRPQKGEDGKATGSPTELIDAVKERVLCPDLFASVGDVAGPGFSQGHLSRGPHPELLESDLPRDGHGRWRVRRSVRALDPHCNVPPGHIIQCIDILWEVVVKNLITHSPKSRSGMLKSAMANPRE